MSLVVQVAPFTGSPSEVEYRWDEDTDILTATIRATGVSEGMSGSVEIEGADGSWLVFDVTDGHINGVEVAVWPEVRKVGTLAAPAKVEDARVTVPSSGSQPEVAALEVDTSLTAESDDDE